MLGDEAAMLETIKGEDLDDFLARGWYRQGYLIFTAHFIAPFGNDKYYRVFWLRYLVRKVHLGKKAKAILVANAGFSVACHPLRITPEISALHQLYAENLSFTINNDLADYLMDPGCKVYESYIIEVRHQGRLIAAGIFDRGQDSIAGIINFYHPDYKRYSPGKFLILQKYLFCLQHNISYYYPGYYMSDHPLFDYKLFLDKKSTEVFLPELQDWIDLVTFEKALAGNLRM